MKIAQFQDNTRPQVISIFPEDHICMNLPMYTRVSEWVDVEFRPLPPSAYCAQQLRALDVKEQELRDSLREVAEVRASLIR